MASPSPDQLPFGNGVRILNAHPQGLLALFKPVGILSHPNQAREIPRALVKAPYDLESECYRVGAGEGEGSPVWLLNRLDSATSGVLLCATEAKLAETIRQEFARGGVAKTYYALVFGLMTPPKQVWRDQLSVSRKGGQLRAAAAAGAAVAETEAILTRRFPGRYPVSLVELHPKTGRTHQLRVQCAKRKLPIIGDETYGNFAWNREFARRTGHKRLFLHSAEVQVSWKQEGRRIHFVSRAPLPPEFSPRR